MNSRYQSTRSENTNLLSDAQLPEPVLRNVLAGLDSFCEAVLLDIIEDSRSSIHKIVASVASAARFRSQLVEADFDELDLVLQETIYNAFRRGLSIGDCQMNSLLEEYFRVSSIS